MCSALFIAIGERAMGKSTSGPDWIDLGTFARQIEEHHKVSVTLLVTPGGGYGGQPLACVVLATPDKLVKVLEGAGWCAEATWPSLRNRTIEGCFYGLLMRIDEILTSERWGQTTLLP